MDTNGKSIFMNKAKSLIASTDDLLNASKESTQRLVNKSEDFSALVKEIIDSTKEKKENKAI